MDEDKKKRKKSKRAIAIVITLLPFLFVILCAIVVVAVVEGLFDFDDEEAEDSIRYIQEGGNAEDLNPDILDQMHLTQDGMDALAQYATNETWQDVYDITLPYYLYIHEQSQKNNRVPTGAKAIKSDKEHYRKYLCYEDVTITGPDLSQFNLTWQDIYMFATTIYIGERNEEYIDGNDIHEVAGVMKPGVIYDEKAESALETVMKYDAISMEEFKKLEGVKELPPITVKEKVAVTPSPTPTPTPLPPGQPTPTPTPTPTPLPSGAPTHTPTPTPVPVEEEIIARIELHYTIRLLPKRIEAWNVRYDISFPEDEDLTQPPTMENASIYARKFEDRVGQIAKRYDVDPDLFELIVDVVDPSDRAVFADALGKLKETSMGVYAPYHIDLEYSDTTDVNEMSWPVPGEHRLASLYEWRDAIKLPDGRRTKPGIHSGWDIGAEFGAEIVAVLAGTVHGVSYDDSSGNYLMIDHGNGVSTLYMHCSKVLVKAGDYVQQNQIIAYVGSTGSSTAPHLHFTMRIDRKNTDPAPYLWPAYERDTEIKYQPNEGATYKYNAWKKSHPD